MKNLFIFTLIVAFVFAQGLRICIHTPEINHGRIAHADSIHYESDDLPHSDTGKDHYISYVSSGLNSFDFAHLLTGLSAFTFLLISLLLLSGADRRFGVPRSVTLLPAHGSRLRPPLRAPPIQHLL